MPRFVNHSLVKDFLADGAVTKHRVVKAGTNDEDVAAGTANATTCIGIALETVADNEPVDIVTKGYAIAEAGGVIARGAVVASDASGRVVSVAIGTTTHDTRGVGIAMEAAGAAGDLISIDVRAPMLVTV